MAFPLGGGGGKGASSTASDEYALAKPYDVSGPPTPDKMEQINEMLEALYNSLISASTQITTIETRVEVVEDDDSGGDVVGPASAVSGNIATFNGTTGKLIQDSGISATALSSLVGSYFVHQQSLTELQIESLNTSAVLLVTAPAGYVVLPIWVALKVVVATGYSGSPGWFLTGDFAIALSETMTPNITVAGTKYIMASGLATVNYTTNDPRATGMYMTANANPANPGTGVATAEVTVAYVLLPLA